MSQGHSMRSLLAIWLVSQVTSFGCGKLDAEFNIRSPSKEDRESDLGNSLLSSGALPVVKTTSGAVAGDSANGILRFRGIPYAQPPIGALRWKPAVPVTPWKNTLSAKAYGSACPQTKSSPSGNTPPSLIGKEDCLYLNVWTSSVTGKKPVMIWIHGGAFSQGTTSGYNPFGIGDLDLYDGLAMAKLGDTVVVNFNYRLGSLGFFAIPELIKEQGSAGNYGITDMITAIKWVKANAAAFGGDPSNIMIFGESAGSYATCALLTSPQTKGLFQKAAMESMYCAARTIAKATELDEQMIKGHSKELCGDSNNRLACLRALPMSTIVSNQDSSQGQPTKFDIDTIGTGEFVRYIPIVDGTILPDLPKNIIKRGEHAKVPMIVGSNSEEASVALLAAKEQVPKTWTDMNAILAQFPDLSASESATLQATYGPSNYKEPAKAFSAMLTDMFMTCSQRELVGNLSAHQSAPVYRYVFDTGVPGFLGLLKNLLGAFHGAELFFLFQNLDEVVAGFPTLSERILAQQMGQYWTSFARYNTPFSYVGPAWSPVSAGKANMKYINIRLSTTSRMETDYHGQVCDILTAHGT